MKKALLFSVWLSISTLTAAAQDGTLDNTFDTDGRVTTAVGSGASAGNGCALQTISSEQRIVVVGQAVGSGGTVDFAVVRYNTDGSLDNTFGASGIAITPIGIGTDVATDVAIDASNRIVVVGTTAVGTTTNIAVVRYNPDGTLDNTFDTDGIVTTDLSGNLNDNANRLLIQPDGKMLMTGNYNKSAAGSDRDDGFVVRYNPNGTLDNTFGTGGIVIENPGLNEQFFDIALQADGKFYAVGQQSSGPNIIFIVAYNADGSRDLTFDGDGRVTIDFAGSTNDIATSVIVTTGSFIVGGWTGEANATDNFFLLEYLDNGTLNPAFGTAGTVITDFASNRDNIGTGMARVFSGGKFLAGGFATGVGAINFSLARYNADGSLDNTFGTGGLVTTDFAAATDVGNSLAIQSNGAIVVAGSAVISGVSRFAVARYNNSLTELPLEDSKPVELSGFSGQSSANGVALAWSTASEKNNQGFSILRDNAVIADYRSSTALNGKGTTAAASAYSFLDATVETGNTYTYQLRSTDFDGTIHTYDKLVAVEHQGASVSAPTEYALMQNYPNPFNPSTSIRFVMKQAGAATVTVSDMLGRTVATETLNAVAGTNTYRFTGTALTSGTYFYQLRAGTFSETRKMTLVK